MKTVFGVNSVISESAIIGSGTKVWHNVQIGENTKIGNNCVIGSSVYIGNNVLIGDNVKIQNAALLFEGVNIESGVFIGPGVIITNDKNPRSVSNDGLLKGKTDWQLESVKIGYGASLGAGTICVAPITIGEWAMTGAGSVVTVDVKKYSLVLGNPARHVGWIGESGKKLVILEEYLYQCPITKQKFELANGHLKKVVNES